MPRTVALFSLGGAPGVTTLAMALASVWPDESGAVLVEADAAGGDIGTWHRLPASPGLTDFAAASRHRQSGAGEGPSAHTQTLPGGLPVCVAPVTADRAGGAVRLLADNNPTLATGPGPAVIADLGRLAPRSATARLALQADTALLVTRDDTAQLRRVKESAPAFTESFSRLRLVVVGGAESAKEIANVMGIPVLAQIGPDDKAAAFLRGERRLSRPQRRPLFKAAATLAGHLAEPAPADPQPTGTAA
ncbi:hypothetical protein ACQEU5_04220 [Marinactinospora thermotolerans]|uniref:MinD-like ATPase involved in chromosome partitioning or flagellar assembly n=1 Tax=Marinactinospora thermotolerans DSM 45154 TaxID=1122192 RepID=A0A1T4QBA9_9ACTN|nr:hypothetical protein [Marinactinospora thermotolerans]SKA00917.1 MinD-like ATPase involved in chromosome partitioning or flagellar assembly [Marinactinospora thermotolerans DSM 45154]